MNFLNLLTIRRRVFSKKQHKKLKIFSKVSNWSYYLTDHIFMHRISMAYTSRRNSVRFFVVGRFNFFLNLYLLISTPRVLIFNNEAISLLDMFNLK